MLEQRYHKRNIDYQIEEYITDRKTVLLGTNEYSGMSRRVRREASDAYNGPSVTVTCLEGFNGGLPQTFFVEAYQRGDLMANITRCVTCIFMGL